MKGMCLGGGRKPRRGGTAGALPGVRHSLPTPASLAECPEARALQRARRGTTGQQRSPPAGSGGAQGLPQQLSLGEVLYVSTGGFPICSSSCEHDSLGLQGASPF